MNVVQSKAWKICCVSFYSLVILSSLSLVILHIINISFFKDINKINSFAFSMVFPVKCNQSDKKSCSLEFCDSASISEEPTEIKKNKPKIFKVIEIQSGKTGIPCGNFYIKNITGKKINFDYYYKKKPKIIIKNKNLPTVLIYHTHTSERYMDDFDGTVSESFYARTQDNSKNVVSVGDEIVKTLNKNGINAIHDCTIHDYPNYNGAYSRSAKTVNDILKKNPSIQIVIDIHRDSIGENKTGKIKPTFKSNGKKVSQIMFISGCGVDKNLKFPNWEQNLTLAMGIQNVCEKCFPGFTREMFVKNVRYNQDIIPGSLLVEVGSDMNTIEESKFAGQMFGESLSVFLNKYKE